MDMDCKYIFILPISILTLYLDSPGNDDDDEDNDGFADAGLGAIGAVFRISLLL